MQMCRPIHRRHCVPLNYHTSHRSDEQHRCVPELYYSAFRHRCDNARRQQDSAPVIFVTSRQQRRCWQLIIPENSIRNSARSRADVTIVCTRLLAWISAPKIIPSSRSCYQPTQCACLFVPKHTKRTHNAHISRIHVRAEKAHARNVDARRVSVLSSSSRQRRPVHRPPIG